MNMICNAHRFLAALVLLASGLAQGDLVSHWTFDSDMNDSAGSNHGTAVNGATTGVPGIIGGGLALDGVNQYVNVGNDPTLNLTGAFAISMWVYKENLNGDQVNTGYYTRGGWNSGASLLAHGQRPVPSGAELWSNYGVDNTELVNGQWYQIALTFDGSSTAAYYVNGKQVTSFTASAATSNTNATGIGVEGLNADGPRWYLKGSIDDVGVYSNALTVTDMALVNGLGRTGGIGLDQLDEARALWAGNVGDTAIIGGATWQKVSGLTGTLGDCSGTVAGGDAVIVLDGSGIGIQVAGGTVETTTELVSSANPSVAGSNVTFMATVKEGVATALAATGTITFSIDDEQVAVEAVAGGQASFTTNSLAAGDHTVTATYSGDDAYGTSSGSLTQSVTSSAYDTWAGASGYDLAGGRDDDDDGDGMTNFQEFAFGLDPTSGASANPITDVSELKDGIFSYTRLVNSGLTYTVLLSEDLQDWNEPDQVTENTESVEDGVETVLVEIFPVPSGDKVFIRVMAD
jgi:hypothetical protein